MLLINTFYKTSNDNEDNKNCFNCRYWHISVDNEIKLTCSGGGRFVSEKLSNVVSVGAMIKGATII